MNELRQRYTVTVTDLKTGAEHRTHVLGYGPRQAAARGVSKLFGRRSSWHQDSGIAGGDYGQVFEALDAPHGNAATSRTNRARLDVQEGWS